MQDFNPYAAPAAQPGYFAPTSTDDIWQQGSLLVFRKGASLPPICLKTNEPAVRQWARSLTWYPSWTLIGLFFGALPFIILVMIMQKRAQVTLYVCEEVWARRSRNVWIGVGLLLTGLAMLGLAIAGVAEPMILVLVAMGLMLIAAIWAAATTNILAPDKITNTHVWLRGVHPSYLARWPDYHGPQS